MSLLIAGVVLWIIAHLFKAAAPGLRDQIEQKLGQGPYRGLFSLLIIGSLILIVFGWKSAIPKSVYAPPLGSGPVVTILILIGLVLFFASQFTGNIKRNLRHPQMAGTILWGTAHLLVNGDSRSVALFGSFTVWALLEIVLINRRDGEWQRPAAASIRHDIIPVAIGSIVFGALLIFHKTLFGVAVS
ncbi:MAG: NnrU family protein [Woeseiaceae bacterium]